MSTKTRDLWGAFPALARGLPEETVAIVDSRVAELHPAVTDSLGSRQVLLVNGGERAKQLREVERILRAMVNVSRHGTLLAVGGGTVGDLATVVAHLHKRGIDLILAPTTLLAAVDSSVGGKGAVNLGLVKNGAGVFHIPVQTWLCHELFATLTPEQTNEGRVEAWKMAACFDARRWRALCARPPALRSLIRDSRRTKKRVCDADPLDLGGERQFLNFGHTFGHVLESLSGHRMTHGAAVRLGVVCALDAGRTLGVTTKAVAEQVQAGFEPLGDQPTRMELARSFRGIEEADVRDLLRADKKGSNSEAIQMVLLTRLGAPVMRGIAPHVFAPLLQAWSEGRVP